MEDYTPEQQATLEAEALARVEAVENDILEASGEKEPDLTNYQDPTTPKTEEAILGKFKSQEDLIKAYQELEKKLGGGESNKDTPQEEQKVEPQDTPVDDTTVNPNDLTEFIDDYSKNGKLSDESYAKLKEMGISKQIADAYIAGQKALVDTTVAKAYESIGGKENYDAMIEWAKENLTESQKSGFNKQLATGDNEVMAMAIDSLYQRYSQANRTPNRVKGDSIAPQATNVYENRLEYMKATGNRLYGSDAKYTAMVDQKYLRSVALGNI